MGAAVASSSLVACSSQVSHTVANFKFDSRTGTLRFSTEEGKWGHIDDSWRNRCKDYDVKTVIIGKGITKINENALSFCENLERVIFPSSVENMQIDNEAFQCCKNLKYIDIPNGVIKMGEAVFSNCISLKKITIPPSVKKMGSRIFDSCEKLECADLSKCGITEVSDQAFCDCKSLEKVAIPPSVTQIGLEAFWCCKKLGNFDIPEGVSEVRRGAFEYCESLEKITIPPSVRLIDDSAFHYCSNLKEVEFPFCDHNDIFHFSLISRKRVMSDSMKELPALSNNAKMMIMSYILRQHFSKDLFIGSEAFSGCPRLKCFRMPPVPRVHVASDAFDKGTEVIDYISLLDKFRLGEIDGV